jgi:hypothetical protein
MKDGNGFLWMNMLWTPRLPRLLHLPLSKLEYGDIALGEPNASQTTSTKEKKTHENKSV